MQLKLTGVAEITNTDIEKNEESLTAALNAISLFAKNLLYVKEPDKF